MKNSSLKRALHLIIASSMVPVSVFPEFSYADAPPRGEQCSPKKTCDEAIAAAGTTSASIGSQPVSQNIRAQGGQLQSGLTQMAGATCNAKKVCTEAVEKCETKARARQETCSEDKCKAIKAAAAKFEAECTTNTAGAMDSGKTQAAATGGGGGDNGMMGALLGAGLGAGMLMMMMKKKQDDSKAAADAAALQQAQQMYNGALQANGTIDCSKPDALVYRDCNSNMENRCRTILDDPTCQTFSARYCGPTSGANAQIMVQPQSPPGVILGVDPSSLYGASGEGMGSAYCRGVTGWNYCKTAGRESCPSCLNIQRNQSPACASNPALCMAQNSTAEIEKAKVSCPTDPAFADPTFASGATAAGAVAAGSGLPAVVLPQSVGAARGSATTPAGATALNPSAGGISVQSVAGGGGDAGAAGLREGVANGALPPQNFAGGGGVAGGYRPGNVAVSGGGREFASAGDMHPASASAVTNEIEGQYGPSLFTSTSQVIRRRCQAGRLNNCP